MTDWRIKEMSELCKVSVRMLRHYDKIGLLKPSYRSPNGYRCYTAEDLAKLQQIIALKYFDFKLNKIKTMLQKHQNVYAHLQAQQQVLKEQNQHLQQVTHTLSQILNKLSPSETPNWHDLTTLIERFSMTDNLREKLQKTWASQLSEVQFEEYLSFYEKFPNEFAERDKIIQQINHNELGNPTGPDGERVAAFMKQLAQKMKVLFTDQIKFNTSLLNDIQSGKISQLETTPDGMLWLSKAMLSYCLKHWNSLYDSILENLNHDPEGPVGKKIAGEWTNLIDDYFSIGTRSLINGIMIWQDLAKQEHELAELKTMPSPQDMLKKVHVKLLFNPEAANWVSKALQKYSN